MRTGQSCCRCLTFISMNIDAAGKLIRRRRKELKIGQRAVAELAGVSIHTLSDIESGKGNPTLDVLGRVLDVLGLEIVIQIRRPT
ncbi:MAG: helix-turn-helix domain-containing protein, partial [Bradymonadaceae bacterium]